MGSTRWAVRGGQYEMSSTKRGEGEQKQVWVPSLMVDKVGVFMLCYSVVRSVGGRL